MKNKALEMREFLIKFRKDTGLSQIQVARNVGVALATYRLWENGVGFPSKPNYDKLMAFVKSEQ